MEEQNKKPSYVGVWLATNLYLEVEILPDQSQVRLLASNRQEIVQFGSLKEFLKKIKQLAKLCKKVGEQ